MPYKNKADLDAYNRRRYDRQKNDPEYKRKKAEQAAKRYKRNKQDPNYLSWKQRLLKEHKEVPCDACGDTFPHQCMDFHHKDPEEKSFTISASGNDKRELLEAEIAKCYVLCCMCHRKIHSNLLTIL